MTGVELREAVSTEAMRAEADQLNASVREASRAMWERERRARQLAWEADLIDAAENVKAEYDGTSLRLPGLDAAVAAALAAKRAAEDRRDDDEALLATRHAELSKAEADNAPAAVQEELAARVHQLARAAAASERAVSKPASALEAAKAERDAWAAYVAGLYAEHVQAARVAENPGTAPGMPMLAPGVARISDLGEEERQYLAALTIISSNLRSDPAPAAPTEEAILKDQSRWRMLKTGRGAGVIIPPRMP
jgi:hypothetical protein